MATASLALLKGAKPKSPVEEVPAPVAAPEAETDTVTVDVDAMNAAQITALVKEQEIDVPEGWNKLTLAAKKSWLNDTFADQPEEAEAAAEPEPVVEAPKSKITKTTTKAKAAPVEATVIEDPIAEAEAPAAEPVATVEAASMEVAIVPKGKKGKVSKGSLTGETENPGEDVISDIVHEIENLKEKEARALVGELAEASEFTYFRLGGVLSHIQAQGWYTPYASFREYVEGEHGINYRRANYWVAIYNDLASSGVSWAKVKHLGWTKLKELAPIMTKDNVAEWVEAVAGKTTLQIQEMVKSNQQSNAPKALEDQASKTVTTKTFKVHQDQKETIEAALAKAREIMGTSVDTVALEHICIEFTGGSHNTMEARMKMMGVDEVLAVFEKAFPDVELTVGVPDDAEA